MKYLIFLFSLIFIFAIASIISFNRKEIIKKALPISILIIIECALAYILLQTHLGVLALTSVATGVHTLMSFANQGINFVFGDVTNKNDVVFVVVALLPIVFICSIIGLLKYLGVLRVFIIVMGTIVNKITRVGKLESFSAVNAVIVGMTTLYISIKEYIPNMSKAQIYTIAACSVSTVDLALIGAYMSMIEPKYVLLGIVLNFFSTFVIVSIINPSDYTEIASDQLNISLNKKQSLFEVLAEHMQDGFKIILSIIPMLLGFIALISLLNAISLSFLGISFQGILGYIFSPVSWLLGVPWSQAEIFGQLIATKVLTNEFVAMLDFMKLKGLDYRSEAIISVFLVSFANFGSIGMIIGTVSSISKVHANMIAANSFRLIIGSTLVSCLSATLIGLII
ncbi:TPA: NupC/NupG family nucleoside CNT transporter [Klebsiella pneumoniae]|jgi:nucleoside transporter